MLERTAHVNQKVSFMWDCVSNLNSDPVQVLNTTGRSGKATHVQLLAHYEHQESPYYQGTTHKELSAF